MHDKTDYFPSKLARNEQFCNRVAERQALKHNITLGRHTVLVSPRRYGKSSLVHQAASEIALPFESIDLFLAHDDKTVTKRLLTGVGNLVSQIIPVQHKALTVIQKYFSNFRVTFSTTGLELSHAASSVDSVDQILDALNSLVRLATEKKKKVLLFIDEFQDIVNAENAKSIQGAIRHVAQDTSQIVFIFSGSNRQLLLNLFDDKNKPLYMLCDKILLDRIASVDYYPHLQKAAKDKWGKLLGQDVLNKILTLTELHPFYVNLLCNELWKNNKTPTMDDVLQAWGMCYEIEERRLVAELEKLTSNQQDLLKLIALHSVREPTSQNFLSLAGISLSSVRMGMKSLLEKDMLYIVKKEDSDLPMFKKDQYRVLDPLLAFALRKYS